MQRHQAGCPALHEEIHQDPVPGEWSRIGIFPAIAIDEVICKHLRQVRQIPAALAPDDDQGFRLMAQPVLAAELCCRGGIDIQHQRSQRRSAGEVLREAAGKALGLNRRRCSESGAGRRGDPHPDGGSVRGGRLAGNHHHSIRSRLHRGGAQTFPKIHRRRLRCGGVEGGGPARKKEDHQSGGPQARE